MITLSSSGATIFTYPTTNLELKERVVLVTGGAKGIGAAILNNCARESAIAVAVDRDLPASQRLKENLSDQGLHINFIATERSSPDDKL